MSGHDERMRKRVKIGHDDEAGGGGGNASRDGLGLVGAAGEKKKNWSNPKAKKREGQSTGKGKGNGKGEGQSKPKYHHSGSGSKFSASGLHAGDVGVFVTCDKGMEKRALRELEDLLGEILGREGGGGDDNAGRMGGGDEAKVAGQEGATAEEHGGGNGDDVEARKAAGDTDLDIESEIRAELQEMRGKGRVEDGRGGRLRAGDGTIPAGGDDTATSHHDDIDISKDSKLTTTTMLGLVTLDIPCVSFVRLPQPRRQPHDQTFNQTALSNGTDKLDPVSLVYTLCRTAYQDPLRQRSRYIKRLTPVSKMRKVMGEGVERLCSEVLDDVFAARAVAGETEDEDGAEGRGWKYAVRVTVRNNNQVSKDDIIKTVAGHVVAVGKGDADSGVMQKERDGGNTGSEDELDEDQQREGNRLDPTAIEDVPLDPGSTTEDGKAETSSLVSRQHQVDLKNYEKLILVEVYRNVVGMSVVGDAREHEDQLRKFNMAEIYAEGRKRVVGEGEEK